MKTLIKKSTPSNAVFSNLSRVALTKQEQKKLKGGEGSDIIIIEIIEG